MFTYLVTDSVTPTETMPINLLFTFCEVIDLIHF